MAYYDDRYQDAPATQGAPDALSVSAAMALAKGTLENLTVRILGEVSEVSVKAGYKAAYFTIKDAGAALPCLMWNNRYRASGVTLQVGQLVEVTGRFTLYAAKGRMNFDVSTLSLSGEGELRMRVANIAKRLSAEGLTDPLRKKPLPIYPERIGLVTSPRSAAVHDVLRTLRRRFPLATVLLAGVPVEGASAPAEIIDGLRCVVEAGAEVVLVVRGGGSFEDLMPFNDEALARAIAACPVPVVTGIGHEVDTSIADMVSDVRASTPTAAAEAASPSAEELAALAWSSEAALDHAISNAFALHERKVETLEQRPLFADPLQLFAAEAQMLDYASERLERLLPMLCTREVDMIESLDRRMAAIAPTLTDKFVAMFDKAAAQLNSLSPVNTLARGFSVTRLATGEVVRRAEQAPCGSRVEVTLSSGTLLCDVVDVEERGLLDS